jgi:hypothetical protein
VSGKAVFGKPAPYSATNAVEAIGKALGEIKAADNLTWDDVGAGLGISGDSAMHYYAGTSTMNAVTFGRGKKEWGSRFTGYFDRLCEAAGFGEHNDRACETSVLKAALALSVALADDNKISAAEIRAHRQDIEAARDALGSLLGRLRAVA